MTRPGRTRGVADVDAFRLTAAELVGVARAGGVPAIVGRPRDTSLVYLDYLR